MYDNHTHTVKDRIVSISQPYIRPIVRGKTKDPVEFGAKLDMSLDEDEKLYRIVHHSDECGAAEQGFFASIFKTDHLENKAVHIGAVR